MRIARKSREKWKRQALVILLVISMVLSSNYSIGEAKTKLIKNTGKVARHFLAVRNLQM